MNNYRFRKPCHMNNNNSNMNDNDCDMDNDNCNMNAEENCQMFEQNCKCSNTVQAPACNCECGFDTGEESMFPENPMLAQSYVPIQRMKKVFNPEVGLKMGTIFPELVSPYTPCQSIREIEYIKNTNQIGEGCNK